ncbi:hypothetical protein A2U01_0002012, partial [Trifolium medium]|nr:hypothetical protein [Trifolium medium]
HNVAHARHAHACPRRIGPLGPVQNMSPPSRHTRSTMADETHVQQSPENEVRRTHANASVVDEDPDPSTWVANEPLNTPSKWSVDFPDGMPDEFF